MTDIVPPDDRISAYLDGALSATEHYEVQQLLVASPEWRKQLDEVAWARVTVRAMPAKVAPSDFFEGLLRGGLHEREVQKEPKGPPKRVRGRAAKAASRIPEAEPELPAPAAFADAPAELDEDHLDAPVALEGGDPDAFVELDAGDLDATVIEVAETAPDRTDVPHKVEDMPFAAAVEEYQSRAAAPPPPPPPPPPAPIDPDLLGPPQAFPPPAEGPQAGPQGLPPIPQPTSDAPLLPEAPLTWDRPVTPTGPPPRQTRHDIVAEKDAVLRPPPVRRDRGDATTLWGKPAPRRRPPREPAEQAFPAPESPAQVLEAQSAGELTFTVEPDPFEPDTVEPIPLERARSARSRRALRWAAGAAAAAAVVLAAIVVPSRGSVAPPVPEFAGAHSVRSSVTDDPVMQLATIGAASPFGR